MDDIPVPGSSAPTIRLDGGVSLLSIELPGPCEDPFKTLDLLGGPSHFASVLRAHLEQPNTPFAIPELRLRPDDSFAHPVSGGIVESSNIVLKVTKRRRKRRRLDNGEEGVFTVEHVGNISQTVRFRDILDYQHAAPMHDPAVQLSEGMRNLDFKSVADYAFPAPQEDPPDELDLVPPPIFSRNALPQWYGYKRNAQTKVVSTTNAQGEEVDRLQNTSRYSVVAPIAISYADGVVPTKPPAGIKEGVGTEASLIKRLKELLQQRPVWTRLALLNQLSPDHHRNVLYNKQALPFLTYTFSDGPFRELVIRLGYDPRIDEGARFFQRVQLRVATDKQPRAKTTAVKSGQRLATNTTDSIDRKSHLFDGVELHTDIGTFQYFDLKDPLLQSLVHEPRFFRSTCHPIDGWYIAEFTDHLRNILKQKFSGLINGRPVSDADLAADVERMRALPAEGEGDEEGSASDGSKSDAGSEAVKAKQTRKRDGSKKSKKTKPKAKSPVGERAVPDALKGVREAAQASPSVAAPR